MMLLCVIVARYLLVMIHIQMLFTGLLSIIHINEYTAIQMDNNALNPWKNLEDFGSYVLYEYLYLNIYICVLNFHYRSKYGTGQT